MIKAKVTSKFQLTIPKKVVEYLGLKESEKVAFTLEKLGNRRCVIMEKFECECPVCNGEGNISEYECIACGGTGEPEVGVSLFTQINNMLYRYACKYKLSYNITNQDRTFPKIKLISDSLPPDVLALFNDYFQGRLIREESMDVKENGLFISPSDELYDGYLESMKTEEGKKMIADLFKK
jgi:AbrB family looped-hinge helix DNA binding protein